MLIVCIVKVSPTFGHANAISHAVFMDRIRNQIQLLKFA